MRLGLFSCRLPVMEHEFICEVCGLTEMLTDELAYTSGWDYPPFVGVWAIISPRACPDCDMTDTAWWALQTGTSPDDLTDKQKEAVERIIYEVPRS